MGEICFEINYKGKNYVSKDGFEIISDNEYEEIYKQWYALPKLRDVLIEMSALRKGGCVISNITKYYFRKLMDNTLHYKCKWSINEVMESKELLSVFVEKVKKNKKVFDSDNIIDNLDAAFRLGGKGIATKVAQFPVQTADYILSKYNVNNCWYDYSCGWGGRLSSALKNKVNYYGTDPNYLLADKLVEYANTYKKNQCYGETFATHIYCQGSEKFIPELENKIGLAFSSPPYFLLEDYKIGQQSYKEGMEYKDWLNFYLYPTMKNIHKYLICDGFFIVNIKDFSKYTLEKDAIKCAEYAGFYLYATETLSNNARCASVGNGEFEMVDNDENIYVFAKKGYAPKTIDPKQINMFDLF